jgi:hypothetical protein
MAPFDNTLYVCGEARFTISSVVSRCFDATIKVLGKLSVMSSLIGGKTPNYFFSL